MDLTEYDNKFRDALYWLHYADRHYYSSQIVYGHVEPFMNAETDLSDEDDQHFLALWESYFLLMSLAFENLLKGLIISIEPDLEDIDDYRKKYCFSYNHNLMIMFDRNFRSLTSIEKELIKRLQTYLNWMSKYPLPLKTKFLNDSKHQLRLTDNECLKSIYKEIEINLRSNCDKNPIRYWKGIGLIK